MSAAEVDQVLSHRSGFSAPFEKCSYCPAAILRIHHSINDLPPSAQVIYAGLASHPAGAVQTECMLRISRDRAYGKRGPPAYSL
jgi:hypothetical protein